MGFTVFCENATLDFDLARGVEAMRVYVKGQSPVPIKNAPTDGYLEELRYFVECVRNNRPPSVATAQDAVAVLEICEAEERSLRHRRMENV